MSFQFSEDELVIFATNTLEYATITDNADNSNSISNNIFFKHYKKILESPTKEDKDALDSLKRDLSILLREKKSLQDVNEHLLILLDTLNVIKKAHDAIGEKKLISTETFNATIGEEGEGKFPLQDALEYIQPFYQYEYLANIIFTSKSLGAPLNAEASIALMKQISLYLSLLNSNVLRTSKDYETYKNRFIKLEEEHVFFLIKEYLYPSIDNVAKSALNRLQSWERMMRDGDWVSPTSLMQQINSDYLQLASGPIGRVIGGIAEYCGGGGGGGVGGGVGDKSLSYPPFKGLIINDFLLFRGDICKRILLPLEDDSSKYEFALYVIGMEEDIFKRLVLRGGSVGDLSYPFKVIFTKHLVSDLMSLFIGSIKDLSSLMILEEEYCSGGGIRRSDWQAMFIIKCKDECLRKKCIHSRSHANGLESSEKD